MSTIDYIYRCYSPSRDESAGDAVGDTWSSDPSDFQVIMEDLNLGPAPRDWELQSARAEWTTEQTD